MLKEKRLILLRRMLRFLKWCAAKKMQRPWLIWWQYIKILRRHEWLLHFIKLCRYHLYVIKIQKKLRYWFQYGRISFIKKVHCKLHFSIRRHLEECTLNGKVWLDKQNDAAAAAAAAAAAGGGGGGGAGVTTMSASILRSKYSLDPWTFQKIIIGLEELQQRTLRIVKHGEIFFKFYRGGKGNQQLPQSQQKKLYLTLDRGIRQYPLWQASRFRGIGIISRGISADSSYSEWGESYEWHLLQSCDRRYRSCQSALDFVTNMFDRHGNKLDLLEIQKILRDFLRSLDPLFVHDYERTLERCSGTQNNYFAWFFVGVFLCPTCYSILDVKDEHCPGCEMKRHQQMKKNLTYSQILAIPNKQGKVELTKTRKEIILPKKKNNIILRVERPTSLSEIETDVLPFLLHAHFWTTAPKRYGKGREIESRKDIWNQSARETLEWSKTMREKHGVDTVAKLGLWSVKRLERIGHVPAKTARTIGLMLGMLQREMDKWRTTNGESVLLSKNGCKSQHIAGDSVVEVPDVFK